MCVRSVSPVSHKNKYEDQNVAASCANLRQLTTLVRMCVRRSENASLYVCKYCNIYKYNAARHGTSCTQYTYTHTQHLHTDFADLAGWLWRGHFYEKYGAVGMETH